MKAVLGLKVGPGHDTGAALVLERSNRIEVMAISQERLNHEKHSRAFPSDAIAYCLDGLGITLDDVSLVVSDYLWRPAIDDSFAGSESPYLADSRAFFRRLEQAGVPFFFAEHHLCHAASAFYATPWEDAVGVVIDGFGSEFETQSIFNCSRSGMTRLQTNRKPGVGIMYASVTEKLLGFDHLQEGKTMGLAGWTDSGADFGSAFQSLPGEQPLANIYPQFYSESPNREHWRLDAPAHLAVRQSGQDPTQAPFVNYAHAAQSELEDQVLQVVAQAKRISGKRRLAYSGGVALNILANRKIYDAGLFDEITIQPAASDPGIPLGAALLGYYVVLGGTRRWDMSHAFLAKEYDEQSLADACSNRLGPTTTYDPQQLARILANNYLVAWYQGASEFGPRALGHRSILCCPRHPSMKAYLNQEVKHREMFRPFAPIVPVERQSQFFDLSVPSPYMLINAKVHAAHQSLIPAVVHADGTARVQSIDKGTNPALHGLLNAVDAETNCPILLNTSLNLAGEPIVETPEDVMDLFDRAKLDVLVMGSHVLSKRPIEQYLECSNPGLDQIAPYQPKAPSRIQAA